jgi:hypothetical protein
MRPATAAVRMRPYGFTQQTILTQKTILLEFEMKLQENEIII